MRVAEALQHAAELTSASAALDTELILAHALNKDRTYLRTWPEQLLSEEQKACFLALIARRKAGEPVAYLIGRQGFWHFDLQVNRHTLIPRPDTETLVEIALQQALPAAAQVLDLGTGTGAIALALALERPQWHLVGVDRVPEAVALAKDNAKQLAATNTQWLQSDWLRQVPHRHFDMIVSNPPYIAPNDRHLCEGDVRFEPASALVADDDGLADIRQIANDARSYLGPGAPLLFEHGFDQAAAVRHILSEAGYLMPRTEQDLAGNDRVSLAYAPGAKVS